MRKILHQYIEKIGEDSYINNKNDIYFYIDEFLFYKIEYQTLRLNIDSHLNQSIEEIKNQGGYSEQTKNTFTLDANKSKLLYNNIKSFFILLILEVAKILEVNIDLKNQLNKNIKIIPYERLKNGKNKTVETISDQIIHFRDACVHHRDKEISKRPEFKDLNIGKDLHLDPACNYDTNTHVFMVGHGMFEVETIEKIIKEVCVYNGIKINL